MPIVRELYPPDWPAIAEAAKARAGWRCVCCGVAHRAGRGREIGVHHFDGDPSNNEPWNLHPLCTPCHLVAEQPRWSPFGPQTRELLGADDDRFGRWFAAARALYLQHRPDGLRRRRAPRRGANGSAAAVPVRSRARSVFPQPRYGVRRALARLETLARACERGSAQWHGVLQLLTLVELLGLVEQPLDADHAAWWRLLRAAREPFAAELGALGKQPATAHAAASLGNALGAAISLAAHGKSKAIAAAIVARAKSIREAWIERLANPRRRSRA